MTNEEIQAGRETDKLIGEKVFGYSYIVRRSVDGYEQICVEGEPGTLRPYSTDIASAFTLAMPMRERGWRMSVWQEWNGSWFAVFGTGFAPNHDKQAAAETPALAICKAALKVLGE